MSLHVAEWQIRKNIHCIIILFRNIDIHYNRKGKRIMEKILQNSEREKGWNSNIQQ